MESVKSLFKYAKDLPYRDRVEVFGLRDGKVLGGYYDDDKTHGVFGGGIDPGEDPSEAAAREFMEESGYKLKNPKVLPIDPVTYDWKPPYDTPQQAERAKKFKGSRTLFATGEVEGEPQTATDPSWLQNIRFRSLGTAYRRTTPATALAPELAKQRKRTLLHLIEALRERPKMASFTPDFDPMQSTTGLYCLTKQAADDKPLRKHIESELKKVDTDATDAQREAGNRQLGHLKMHGLDITIEYPKGSVRTGKSKDGKTWSRNMTASYGYIRGKRQKAARLSYGETADKEHIDCFIGEHPESQLVFVVDQKKADGGFDEHKVLLACRSRHEATELYSKHYPKDWVVGPVTPLTMDQFKDWLQDGDLTRPLSDQTLTIKSAVNHDSSVDMSMPVVVLSHSTSIRLSIPRKSRTADGKFTKVDDLKKVFPIKLGPFLQLAKQLEKATQS